MYLIDTNVLSELRRGSRGNLGAIRWMREQDPVDTATSVLVLGELRRGVELARVMSPAQYAGLLNWYRSIRNGFGDRILTVTETVATKWATISVPDPLPVMDGLIAATALVHDLVVVTRNISDFQRTGVRLLDPFD